MRTWASRAAGDVTAPCVRPWAGQARRYGVVTVCAHVPDHDRVARAPCGAPFRLVRGVPVRHARGAHVHAPRGHGACRAGAAPRVAHHATPRAAPAAAHDARRVATRTARGHARTLTTRREPRGRDTRWARSGRTVILLNADDVAGKAMAATRRASDR